MDREQAEAVGEEAELRREAAAASAYSVDERTEHRPAARNGAAAVPAASQEADRAEAVRQWSGPAPTTTKGAQQGQGQAEGRGPQGARRNVLSEETTVTWIPLTVTALLINKVCCNWHLLALHNFAYFDDKE